MVIRGKKEQLILPLLPTRSGCDGADTDGNQLRGAAVDDCARDRVSADRHRWGTTYAATRASRAFLLHKYESSAAYSRKRRLRTARLDL